MKTQQKMLIAWVAEAVAHASSAASAVAVPNQAWANPWGPLGAWVDNQVDLEDQEEEVASIQRAEGASEACLGAWLVGTVLEGAEVLAASAASCSWSEEATAQVAVEEAGRGVAVQAVVSCLAEGAVGVASPASEGLALAVHQQRADEACQPGKVGSGQPEVFQRPSRASRLSRLS